MNAGDLTIQGKAGDGQSLVQTVLGSLRGGAVRPTSLDAESDAVLIRLCQEGSVEAYGALLGRYRERVLNFAYALLGSRDDAEDAAQEAFIKVFSAIHSYRSEAQFWTWLYRITLNICLHRKRRGRKELCLEEAALNLVDGRPDASTEAETRVATLTTLNELSMPLRAVLVLREMHELSYEDIARILDVPVGTVRSRISEARRKFRLAWQEEV